MFVYNLVGKTSVFGLEKYTVIIETFYLPLPIFYVNFLIRNLVYLQKLLNGKFDNKDTILSKKYQFIEVDILHLTR